MDRRRGATPHYRASADRDLFVGWVSTFVVGAMLGATLALMVAA